MYQRVHLRLTILCAVITTAIMIVMSFLYLQISENNLYKNQFAVFESDVNTISASLERQSVLTTEFLTGMKMEHNYSFFLLDNGIPFLCHQLTELSDQSGQSFLWEILSAYALAHDASPFAPQYSTGQLAAWRTETSDASSKTPGCISFLLTSKAMNRNYFCSVIEIDRGAAPLQAIVLFPLEFLEKQILGQRIRFIAIDGITLALLLIFSWIFTGQLLKPILENQQKQMQFVASASHELRTPLAVILSSAECLSDTACENQAGFVKNICQAGNSMSSLVEDMLTLSLSDSYRFSMQKKPVELDTLLLNHYESFEPLARQKSIALSLHLPEASLPPCLCDPERISQVVSILLHNGISYTDSFGKIEVSLSYTKRSFVITVSDNGIGISDEDKKKIFDRFYRGEKSRSAKGHFGLGLSIAYEIVTAHHGSLTVKDSPQGGSLFTVMLPEDKTPSHSYLHFTL